MQDQTFFQMFVSQISLLTVPLMFFLFVGYALIKRVKVYEAFIEGGKEGFDVFLSIMPYIVTILIAIGVFRMSGALEVVSGFVAPLAEWIGMPVDVVPVALMKPLSGSGALGMVNDVLLQDPDSFSSKVASTMFGSTDTTLYIIALYFGSVGITKIRHAMIAGLIADLAGILAAVWICHLAFPQ
jgi:spore maturation protein B